MFQIVELLLVFQFLPSSDGGLDCDGRSGVAGPGPPAAVSVQEPQCQIPSLSLYLGFATEGANVLDMLADCNFLHHFPEGGAITDPYLLTIPTLLRLAMSPQTRSEHSCLVSHHQFLKITLKLVGRRFRLGK